MKYINTFSVLLILALCLIYYFDNKSDNNTSGETGKKCIAVRKTRFNKVFQVILIIGIIAGIILRGFRFGSVPGGVNQDGAMAAVDAKALADYGTDRYGTFMPAHFYAWGYGQMSVLMSYLMIPFIKLFGMNNITIRLPILIASILGIIVIYFIVRLIISHEAGLIAALFTAINPWHFMQSRWALDCNMFPHMFILGLMFLILGMKKKKYIYISMIFFALCMYSYGVSFYMVPFFLLVSAIFLVKDRIVKVKDILISLVVYFGLAFPIYITMIINAFDMETIKLPFVTMQYFKDSVRSNDMIIFSEHFSDQLRINIRSLINVTLLQKQDLIWNTIDPYGTLYKCTIPLVFMGIIIVVNKLRKVKNKYRKNALRMLLLYWIFSVLVGIFINGVFVNRINIIYYSNIIFAAIALLYIVSWWKKMIPVLAVSYCILASCFFVTYFTTWEDEIAGCFYSDFVDAMEYAESLNSNRYYISPDTQYEGSVNVSEILTLYTMNIDSKYFRGETNIFNGKEIAYSDRYIYSNPYDLIPEKVKGTTYIIKSDIVGNYDFSDWEEEDFGNYKVISY